MGQKTDLEPYKPYPLKLILELDFLMHERMRKKLEIESESVDKIDARVRDICRKLMTCGAPHIGDIVAGAKLTSFIDSGSFGSVWRAIRHSDNTPCAVKVFNSAGFIKDRMSREFRQGVSAMRALTSAGPPKSVVRLIESEDSELAFSMTLIAGKDLRDIAERGWRLSKKLAVFEEICGAVRFAHEHKVIHRDIKPANIVLDSSDNPVLTDFDLADLQTLNTLTTRSPGSFVYAAPEQFEPIKGIEEYRRLPESDIYSLGRLLFYFITESEPSGAYREPIPTLGELGDQEGLRRIICHCTLRDPRQRYKSVDDLLTDLKSYRRDEEIEFDVAAGFPRHSVNPILPRPVRINKRPTFNVVVVAALITATAAIVAAIITGVFRVYAAHETRREALLSSAGSTSPKPIADSSVNADASSNVALPQTADVPAACPLSTSPAPNYAPGVGILQIAHTSCVRNAKSGLQRMKAQNQRMGDLLNRAGERKWLGVLSSYVGQGKIPICRLVFNNVKPAAGDKMCDWLRCQRWTGGCAFIDESGEDVKSPTSFPPSEASADQAIQAGAAPSAPLTTDAGDTSGVDAGMGHSSR